MDNADPTLNILGPIITVNLFWDPLEVDHLIQSLSLDPDSPLDILPDGPGGQFIGPPVRAADGDEFVESLAHALCYD